MAETKFDLQKLQVASPCYERWDAMKGDDRVRHCASCKLNVYNVRAMTTTEVEELVQRSNGRLCLRLYKRWDGTVLTRDCPVGLRRARVRMGTALLTATAFALVLLMPLLIKLGSKHSSSTENLTFEERMEVLRYRAYEIPVIGFVLAKIIPPPTYTLGAVGP
ncbi:hypothetical protein [Hyalangium versicolor]|uniref:hypothetical protein n=1 Tax=Hyalangium versicolor TaxID=2861190 RepID=UPI001CCA051D|nr:hypothetical protein [Hyalangium versicolor]